MTLRIVRLGSARLPEEGLRLGTVRRPPRGVPRSEYAARNYYDVWMPVLAPSPALVARARGARTESEWRRVVRAYRREMSRPEPRAVIELLSRLSAVADISLGCYCEDEARCHRSVLRALLHEAGARIL